MYVCHCEARTGLCKVGLITRRSSVQICPPQPSEFVAGPYYETAPFLFRAGSKLLLPGNAASPHRIGASCESHLRAFSVLSWPAWFRQTRVPVGRIVSLGRTLVCRRGAIRPIRVPPIAAVP